MSKKSSSSSDETAEKYSVVVDVAELNIDDVVRAAASSLSTREFCTSEKVTERIADLSFK
jgi:hypothetical protein